VDLYTNSKYNKTLEKLYDKNNRCPILFYKFLNNFNEF